jgi:hypothetical protein
MKTYGLLMFVVALIFALPGLASADIFIQQLTHTDSGKVAGQNMPARDDTTSVWIADGKAKMVSHDATMLILVDKDAMYVINDKDKTYSQMKLSEAGDITAMLKEQGVDVDNEEQMAMMKGMMSAMQIKATVTPTDETKKIEGYECKKYDVDFTIGMGKISSIYWVTPDIKIDYDMLYKIQNAMMLRMPGSMEAMKELEKMDGFPVYTETTANMMGASIKSTTKLLKYAEKSAPAGTFVLPEGYKETEMKAMPGR